MEEQKSNKGLIIIVCILSVLVLTLSGYIVYDKFFSKSEQKVNIIENNNQTQELQTSDNSNVIDNNKSTELPNGAIKENSLSVPTSDLVTLIFEASDEAVDVFYGYISNGLLYYFNDAKTANGVNEGAFDFITAFFGDEISKYSKLNNIKRIKSFNRGTGVSPEVFLITDNGKVYSTRDLFSKNINFSLTNEFKNYEVEDILNKTGEMEEIFELLLKDGNTIKVKI